MSGSSEFGQKRAWQSSAKLGRASCCTAATPVIGGPGHRNSYDDRSGRDVLATARPRRKTAMLDDLAYGAYSETARTVRPLVRLWGVSKSIRCPGDRPIKAAPTGVRTETRLSSMFASCG